VLVTVGEQAITLGEMQRAFEEIVALNEGYRPDSLSARRFLQDYIAKTLMEQMAADSIPWTPRLEHRAESFLETLMVRKLRQDTYGTAVRVSESDIRETYEQARTRYHYRAIPFSSDGEALRHLHLVREGAHFPKMADHVTGRSDGGDMGWQTALTAPAAVIAVLEVLSPEEVGGPVEVTGRYYLLQLLASEPNPDLASFESVSHGVRIQLIQERGGALLAEFHRHLFEKYRFEVRMDQVLWMTAFLREKTAHVEREVELEDLQGDAGALSKSLEDRVSWEGCPLEDRDRDRILATTTVDTLSAVLLLDHLMTKLTFTWPCFDKPDDVMTLLRELALSRLERAEAWNLRYDEDPDLVWRATKQKNLIHTRQFFLRKVRSRARPSLEEARQWYEAQAAGRPETRSYVMIVVRDWDTALEARNILARVADPGQSFAAVKEIDAEASWIGSDVVTVSAAQVSSSIDRQVFRLVKGQVTDPVPIGDRFAVARVEGIRRGGVKPFEQMAEEVVGHLEQIRADSLLGVYLAQRREITPIHINESVFAKLRYDRQAP
jgi:parvulin-like peptidyl-prolyl isomerase